MVSTATEDTTIDCKFMVRLVKLSNLSRIPMTLTFDGRDYIIEGTPRRCYEKSKALVRIELLKPVSTNTCLIFEFAALACLKDALHRLISTGENFATLTHRNWEQPAIVWRLLSD